VSLILIVDDSRDTVNMLKTFLKRWGHETLTAGTGEAGLALLADHDPDLVVVDGMMPGMNGSEFIRALRANEKTALIPVILYTAVSQDEFTQNAIEKGANEVWIKGKVEFDHIQARVAHHVSRGRA
jgi:CheY-like chemotaxis protein